MGYIDKFVKNEANRAIDQVQNFVDKLGASVSRVNGFLGTAFESLKSGESFVGLQYSSIESIRGAIRTYVTNVRNVVDKLNSEASNDNAIKGEAAAAAKTYVQTISKMAEQFVSQLLAYSDKMYEYGEAYKKNDTTLAQNISDEATSLSSSVEEYTEKY